MAAQYRFEKIHRDIAGVITVDTLLWSEEHPTEQTLLSIEFPEGTTPNVIQTTIRQYAGIIRAMERTST
ncbi:MAG: hypothetical protein E6Q97_38240 [Desulfurellales bacterium]|nr:MAG: hypothetical protein E6Q97_38240 [Desulfurellales bacterium]